MENTMAFKEYKIIHVVEDGLGKILFQSDIGFLPHFFAISIKIQLVETNLMIIFYTQI